MTLQESRPVSDPLLALQQFEQAFAQARQLLIDTQTLSPTHAGNISLRVGDQEKLLIASLAGPDAGTAVLLDFDLRTHQGTLSANLQEVAALHVAILRERPQATSVIHTHSLYLTAHAIARRPLRPYSSGLLGLLREDQQIPVSEWGPRYTSQPVIDLLRDDTTAPAVLLANHGPFAWSEKGVLGAARLLVALEDAAHLALLAEQLGGAQALPAGAAELARRGWQAP